MGFLQINTLGTSFTINAKEEPDYLKKLLDYFNQTVQMVEQTTTTQEPIQTAILTGIMLCDELYKEKLRLLKIKKQIDAESLQEVERITAKIIESIDKALI